MLESSNKTNLLKSDSCITIVRVEKRGFFFYFKKSVFSSLLYCSGALLKHLPRHVLERVLRHLLEHMLKYVPDRHVLEHVLGLKKHYYFPPEKKFGQEIFSFFSW